MSPTTVYISGAGHSGSSLLGLLLGSHPQITGTGEIHRLSLNPRTRLCSCHEIIDTCPFWNDVADHLAKREHIDRASLWGDYPVTVDVSDKPRDRPLPNLLEALLLINSRRGLEKASVVEPFIRSYLNAIENSLELYGAISQADGSSHVIDGTKNAVRMKMLFLHQPENFRVIHLVRDGRAVACSGRRRKGVTIEDEAKIWFIANRNVMLMQLGIPSEQVLRIRYEDLCTNPHGTLHRICKFIDVSYSNEMLDFRNPRQHHIPGNPMLSNHENDAIHNSTDNWKKRFDQADNDNFNSTAGGMAYLLNKYFGYDRNFYC